MATSPSKDLTQWIQTLDDPDPEQRIRAVIVLGMLGQKAQSAIPSLILALKREELQFQRLVLASLSEIGTADPAATPVLISALQDAHPLVRRRAIRELADLGTKAVGAIDALASLSTSSDVLMSRWAILAIGRQDTQGASAVPHLIPLLIAPDVISRALAAVALRRIGASALTLIVHALENDTNPEARRRFARWLEKQKDNSPIAMQALQQATTDEDEEVRRIAERATQASDGDS